MPCSIAAKSLYYVPLYIVILTIVTSQELFSIPLYNFEELARILLGFTNIHRDKRGTASSEVNAE